MKAGVPQEKTAFGVNQLCGCGLRAVALGLQQIANGDADIIVAGGQESMSLAPHAAHLRNGVKMGDLKFIDTMIKDGLIDAFHGYHMGNTAENIAAKWQISREEQDRFAVASQNKAEAAQKAGRFKDEIVAVHGRRAARATSSSPTTNSSATARPTTRSPSCAPAFSKEGTVTAGNASGINDGAAALVVMSAAEAEAAAASRRWRASSPGRPPASIPAIMGTGPIPASRKALAGPAGRSRTSISSKPTRRSPRRRSPVNKDLGWDPAIVNVNGGAIAIGHPIGASGARVLVTLLHEMARRNAKKGLATLVHRRRHGHRDDGRALSASSGIDKGAGRRRPRSCRDETIRRGNHEQSCCRHRRHARHRRGDLQGAGGRRLHGRRHLSRQRRSRGEVQGRDRRQRLQVGRRQLRGLRRPAWRKVAKDLGPVDVLVNNAGITKDGMFHKMTPEQWYGVINTNLNSLFNMTPPGDRGHARARLRPHRSTSPRSTARRARWARSIIPPPRPATSASPRRSPRRTRSKGITVNAICPGYIATEMVMAVPQGRAGEDRSCRRSRSRRLGEPEEIARCVVFLASDDAGFITGSTLTANGGQYMA